MSACPRFVCLLLVSILSAMEVHAQRHPVLKPIEEVQVSFPEPSDMVIIPGSVPPRFFVVSDNGHVAEIRHDGSVKRRVDDLAFDLEGALLHEGRLMVVDERSRRILWLDTADLKVVRRLTLPYAGGRNKGYEGLAWNPLKQRFLLITERDPVHILELNAELQVVNEVDFDRSIRDVSSATWYDGHLWLLSDMDRSVMKCDPLHYSVIQQWTIPVINPEGMAFGADGRTYIVSDDRQRLYTFALPNGAAE